MITLAYLWRWLGLAGLTVIALVVEHGVIAEYWHFVAAVAVTLGLFVLISAGLYREWRARAAGYVEIGSK